VLALLLRLSMDISGNNRLTNYYNHIFYEDFYRCFEKNNKKIFGGK